MQLTSWLIFLLALHHSPDPIANGTEWTTEAILQPALFVKMPENRRLLCSVMRELGDALVSDRGRNGSGQTPGVNSAKRPRAGQEKFNFKKVRLSILSELKGKQIPPEYFDDEQQELLKILSARNFKEDVMSDTGHRDKWLRPRLLKLLKAIRGYSGDVKEREEIWPEESKGRPRTEQEITRKFSQMGLDAAWFAQFQNLAKEYTSHLALASPIPTVEIRHRLAALLDPLILEPAQRFIFNEAFGWIWSGKFDARQAIAYVLKKIFGDHSTRPQDLLWVTAQTPVRLDPQMTGQKSLTLDFRIIDHHAEITDFFNRAGGIDFLNLTQDRVDLLVPEFVKKIKALLDIRASLPNHQFNDLQHVTQRVSHGTYSVIFYLLAEGASLTPPSIRDAAYDRLVRKEHEYPGLGTIKGAPYLEILHWLDDLDLLKSVSRIAETIIRRRQKADEDIGRSGEDRPDLIDWYPFNDKKYIGVGTWLKFVTHLYRVIETEAQDAARRETILKEAV